MDSERDYLYYSVFALVIIALLMFFGLVRNIQMSEYFSLYCANCKVRERIEINHGNKFVSALAHNAEKIVSLSESLYPLLYIHSIETADGHTIPIQFLIDHKNHHIKSVSEYEIFDE